MSGVSGRRAAAAPSTTRSSAGARSPGAAARALAAAQARPFARAAGVPGRRGYFREPGQPLGVAEGAAGGASAAQGGEVRLTGGTATWLRLMPAADPERTWTC